VYLRDHLLRGRNADPAIILGGSWQRKGFVGRPDLKITSCRNGSRTEGVNIVGDNRIYQHPVKARPWQGPRSLSPVDCPAAVEGATTANDAIGFRGELIVKRQFFSGMNPSPSEKEDVTPDPPCFHIGIAAVVDSLCSTSSDSPIQNPILVEPKKGIYLRSAAFPGLFLPGPGLPVIQPLPRVLDHFSARRNRLEGEDADVMDSGAANPEGILGESGINKLTAVVV
jgi:hypothetical protein